MERELTFLEIFFGFVLPQLVVVAVIVLLGYVIFRLIRPRTPETKDTHLAKPGH